MPELPDVTIYVEQLERRLVGEPIAAIRLASPFVLRTVDPKPSDAVSRRVTSVSRLGKRIVIHLETSIALVIHLMIAGRFRWKDESGTPIPKKIGLLAVDFPKGTLLLTEASTKKRASLHVVRGAAALAALDPGGLEVLEAPRDAFAAALIRENHTLKRALTDPHLFSGIGNAYSDEILHRAKLSPARLTTKLAEEEITRLYEATRAVLLEWVQRLRLEAGAEFPMNVTAFRKEMSVHGRYNEPCPVCGSRVARIVYAQNEANYCATCQTGGKLLADRALSRLLGKDWPRTLEELETRKAERTVR